MKISKFSGGEMFVQLESNEPESFRFDIRSSDDLMLLMNILSARKHAGLRTGTIIIPYLPYSRQDRVCAEGQPFSLEMLALMFKPYDINKILTLDVHSNSAKRIFASETGIILSSQPPAGLILGNYSNLNKHIEDGLLVCPDQGAINRTKELASAFDKEEGIIIYCTKDRDPKTGDITGTTVHADDLTGRVCVIADDICDGGYTFIKIAEQLKQKNAHKVILYVTHGIFSKGLDVFDDLIDEVYTTNSFEQVPHPKLTVINTEH